MVCYHKGQEYSAVNYSIKIEFAVGQEITKPIRCEISRCSKSQPALLKPGQSTSNSISTVMNISRHFMLAMLIERCGDIALNPGPAGNCLICKGTVRSNQVSVNCNLCNGLLHVKCCDLTDRAGPICHICFPNNSILNNDTTGYSNSKHIVNDLQNLISKRGLTIFHQNICGLFRKIDSLRVLLDSHKGIHILGLGETHLYDDVYDNEIEIAGYKLFRKDRSGNNYGGIVVYLRNTINAIRRIDLEIESIEAIWVEITMPCSRGLLVAHFYRPPDGSQYLDPDFLPKFRDMMSTATSEGKEIIILGDFNTDYNNNQKSKEFKESLKGLGFIQLVKQSTRITKESSTLIDIIATNQNQNILKCSVIKTSLSDHDMVGSVRKLHNIKFKPRTITCRNYKQYNIASFKSEVSNLSFSDYSKFTNIDEAWDNWQTKFLSAVDKHAPLINKRVRGRETPWITSKIKNSMRERDYFLC